MLRKTLMAGVAATLLVGLPVAAIPALAQNSPSGSTMPAPDSMKVDKLIGRNVVNAQNEKIGDINSVYLDRNGKVDSVIVGVGGFLGIGEREVALKWSDLKITENGGKIMVNLTKDQLQAMPQYKYSDNSYRGAVFADNGIVNPPMTGVRNDSSLAVKSTDGKTTADRATMSHDRAGMNHAFNANGDMSGNAIIGADVKNASNETIGKVQDIYIGKDGAVKGIVVGVGGFLGVGEHNVMLSWSKVQLREGNDHNGVVVVTDTSKDMLKAMPEYKQSSL